MTRHVQLNNEQHADLRVRTERSADLGDAVMSCPVFPQEFRRAQASYPLVFSADDQAGGFRPLALFGLERGENLFLGAGGWDAPYLPLAMRMQPFLIGRDAEGGNEVHLDTHHPRVTEPGGEPVFLDQGGQAPLLREASSVLSDVIAGDEAARAFARLCADLDLIEPFTLDVTLADGSSGRLAGLSVIAEERLTALTPDDLGRLQAADALLPVFMMVASVSRFEDLVARRNARLAG